METKNNGPRIIISGGGTGGHATVKLPSSRLRYI